MEDRAVIAFDAADGYNYVVDNLFHPPSVVIIVRPEAFKHLSNLRMVYITDAAAMHPDLPEFITALREAKPGFVYIGPGFYRNPWVQKCIDLSNTMDCNFIKGDW